MLGRMGVKEACEARNAVGGCEQLTGNASRKIYHFLPGTIRLSSARPTNQTAKELRNTGGTGSVWKRPRPRGMEGAIGNSDKLICS